MNSESDIRGIYRILKADKHGKLTEHPKIIAELNNFARRRWTDIATGRAIKFKAGLAQPSLKLKEDEICIPIIPHGKEVIVTRSPLINSNGVIVLKNRHLPEVSHLQGAVHINPDTAAASLQADFDGDRLAFELADKYPVLAAEVKEYNLEQNRYPDIIKRDKVAYQGTFPEIALSAADNKIGLIANQIQRAVALRWETYALPESNKVGYVKNIAQKMSDLVRESQSVPEKYQERVNQLANLPKQLSPEEIDRALETARSINFDLVADLGNELQVAVDGPKSAARPDEELLKTLKAVGGYKYPKWLSDKKNKQAYLDRPMNTNGYSPIDLMVQQTNKSFKENKLQEQPTVTFQPLFDGVTFNKQQKQLGVGILYTYNDLIGKAVSAEKKADQPILKVTSATSGKTIQVDDVLKPGNAQAWREERLDIGVRAHRKATKENQNTLSAVVIQKDGVEKPIGVISAEEIKKHGLKPGHTLRNAEISLEPGITKTQVQAMFKQSQDYLEQFRQNIPEQEKEALAAALWHVSHTKNGDAYRKSSVALNLFPEQVVKQLSKPPVREMQIGGMAHSAYPDKIWQGERVNCEVQKIGDKNSPNYGQKMLLVEGKPLGRFVRDSSSLQHETKFAANLSSPLGAYVMATTAKGNEIKIGQIKNFSFKDNQWKDRPGNLKLGYEWVKNKKEPVAFKDGKILGIIHRDSVKELTNVGKEGRNLIAEGYSPQVSLTRTPPTIVDVKLDTESLVYPWASQGERNVGGNQALPRNSQEKETKEVSLQDKLPNHNPISASEPVKTLSSEAAKIVAPIVRDFLKLKKTKDYQGQRYNAAWKSNNQTLTLEDKSGSTKLEAQYIKGEWQAQVDNLTADDVKVFQGMKPMIQEQLQENSGIEQQRQILRQEYEKLKSEIQAKPDFHNAGVEKKDIAIAMLVIDKEAKNSTGENLINRVGKVLSQSDQLREWKVNMPEAEYRGKAKEYIVDKFEQATQIRTSILAERQQDFNLAR